MGWHRAVAVIRRMSDRVQMGDETDRHATAPTPPCFILFFPLLILIAFA
jgi:hypothetical protein